MRLALLDILFRNLLLPAPLPSSAVDAAALPLLTLRHPLWRLAARVVI
jgi:hypothetical protein